MIRKPNFTQNQDRGENAGVTILRGSFAKRLHVYGLLLSFPTHLFKYDSKTSRVTLFVANTKKEDILMFSVSLHASNSRIKLPHKNCGVVFYLM